MKRKLFKGKTRYLLIGIVTALVCFAFVQAASADPLVVRVQPSGDTFGNAYVITGEARTYFGNVEGGTPPYEYKWEFSDGVGNTAYAAVGDSRYISYDGKTFSTAGTHWARLTIKDNLGVENSATINLQVIAAASDTLVRQKNSAIDRGLRYIYRAESISASGSSWPGSGAWIGSTGMALIALENHAHNLQSADSDIYKKSVQEGVKYLLNNAYKIDIATQPCIGDPEADDGDMNDNGEGVLIGGNNMYIHNIAAMAIVNSCGEATAKATVADTTSGDVNGMTLWDIIVEVKDYIAWAQNDGTVEGNEYSCSGNSNAVYVGMSGASTTYFQAYYWIPDLTQLNCSGTFTINWGDGTSNDYPSDNLYCPYGSGGYATVGYDVNYPSHTYATDDTYTISVSFSDGVHDPVSLCTTQVDVSVVSCGPVENGAGGWRYEPNYEDSDNSVTQWPVLALAEARNRWGIDINPEVINMLNLWLAYSQCDNGGFGYTSPNNWCNFPKTAAGLIMLNYVGKNLSDTAVQNAMNFLDNSWSSTCYDGNFGSMYGMYAFYKGMKIWGLVDLPSHTNWEKSYTEYLVGAQQSDNGWNSCDNWMDYNFATYMALAILAPEVAELPPVANAGGPYPDINPSQTVTLDGSKSLHQDPAKQIIKWCWDFDASNGLWWDTKPAPDAGEGACGITVNTSYPDVGHDQIYTITLQVTDNSSPTPMTDTDTATVEVTTGNVPPVAVTNGPWSGLPNTIITFDGSASYDPNSGPPLNDEIVSYEWDLNADGSFNGAEDGTPDLVLGYKKVTKSFPFPISLPATLKVTDSYGLTGTSSAQYNIVSIAVVYGQEYETCFRERLNRFEERLGVKVRFKNLGDSPAENLVMTLTQTPSNLQILKSQTNLGTLNPGVEKWSACDPTAKTADIELKFDRRIVPSGEWRWRADFDFNGKHYIVDNIPPLL